MVKLRALCLQVITLVISMNHLFPLTALDKLKGSDCIRPYVGALAYTYIYKASDSSFLSYARIGKLFQAPASIWFGLFLTFSCSLYEHVHTRVNSSPAAVKQK